VLCHSGPPAAATSWPGGSRAIAREPGARRNAGIAAAGNVESNPKETEYPAMVKQPYVPPRVTALGTVRHVVLGSAADDTADMNTARYY
jgi:hypothetical protein